MEYNLKTGISYEFSEQVTKQHLASSYGSGGLDVFSTPHMIAIMEKAALLAVQELLPQGHTTVGTKVDIDHVSATALGMTVTAKATLIEIDGRKLMFEVSAYDDAGLIGSGLHGRAIIDCNRFMDKLKDKVTP